MGSIEQVDGTAAISDESRPQTKSLQHLDLHLGPSVGNGSDCVRSNGVNHVLELLCLDAGHLLCFGDLQVVLLTDELCLRLSSSSQSFEL